jgi:galactitol-specific phosphotransferase system IIB component
MLSCLVGILILMVLWLMAEDTSKPVQPNTPVKGELKIYASSQKECEKIQEALKGQGYSTSIKKEQTTVKQVKGYSVAANFPVSVADSIRELLESENYKVTITTASVEEAKCRVQVQGTFTRKAQAESLVKQIEKELEIVFKAEPAYKDVPVEHTVVSIQDLEKEKADKLEAQYREKGKKTEFVEKAPE